MPAAGRPARLARVVRLAKRQRLLVATRQLETLGFGDDARRNAVRQGDLVHRRAGVYGLPGAGSAWEDAVMAAVLATEPGAVASYATAWKLWLGDDTSTPGSGGIELTGERAHRHPGLTAHRQQLPRSEVTTRSSVPVTTVSRTLLDLATQLDAHHLGRLVDDALRSRLVTLRELERVSSVTFGATTRRRSGAWGVLAAVEDRRSGPGPGANAWEERMDRAWDRMGLPVAARQHWIRTPHGSYCVDRALVELKIAIEWNGYEYHGQRGRFDRDSDRRGHLLEAGWLVLDFTSRSSIEHIRRTVLAAVAQRRQVLGIAG